MQIFFINTKSIILLILNMANPNLMNNITCSFQVHRSCLLLQLIQHRIMWSFHNSMSWQDTVCILWFGSPQGLGLAAKALVVSSSGERPGFELRQPTVRSPVRAWDSRRFTHALCPQSTLSRSCGSPDPIWISKQKKWIPRKKAVI